MRGNRYKIAAALRQAITDRLKKIAKTEGIRVNRLFRHLAFDRFLARLFHTEKHCWVLKGGYAMELRMRHSRETKDIDLAMLEMTSNMHAILTEAAALDLGDFFEFEVVRMRKIFSPPQGGNRFHINALLDKRSLAKFHLDVGVGDAIIEPFAMLSSRNWLDFADITCPQFPSISNEQQFAEKIHAYAFPYKNRTSSRVRDIVDMVLLIKNGKLNKDRLKQAIELTFNCYGVRKPPLYLNEPPLTWKASFLELATECELEISLDKAYSIVAKFYSEAISP